nr:phytanoyl-CoA dioxygenase family protein [Qipengyuania mesophila]
MAACVDDILIALAELPQDRAGIRLNGVGPLEKHIGISGCFGSIARQFIGDRAKPVRAILFDKSEGQNWSLGWHQDRTICVGEHCEVEGFGPWSTKAGMLHVEPPFDVIKRMVTLRGHLDPVPETNAPLLIAVGSHRLGRVPTTEVEEIVRASSVEACLAEAGDVWAYRTSIIHASKAAEVGRGRRVLQVDYSADDLPDGLTWAGI